MPVAARRLWETIAAVATIRLAAAAAVAVGCWPLGPPVGLYRTGVVVMYLTCRSASERGYNSAGVIFHLLSYRSVGPPGRISFWIAGRATATVLLAFPHVVRPKNVTAILRAGTVPVYLE